MSDAATCTEPSGSTRASFAVTWSASTDSTPRARELAVEVEAEVADVGAAEGVDDHVVAVERGDARQVGVLDEARRLEAQEPLVEHRDDEQPAVGQPAEAGGLPIRQFDDRSHGAGRSRPS